MEKAVNLTKSVYLINDNGITNASAQRDCFGIGE